MSTRYQNSQSRTHCCWGGMCTIIQPTFGESGYRHAGMFNYGSPNLWKICTRVYHLLNEVSGCATPTEPVPLTGGDSEVQDRIRGTVDFLLKGWICKKGSSNNKCRCHKKEGSYCSPGCECQMCMNIPLQQHLSRIPVTGKTVLLHAMVQAARKQLIWKALKQK